MHKRIQITKRLYKRSLYVTLALVISIAQCNTLLPLLSSEASADPISPWLNTLSTPTIDSGQPTVASTYDNIAIDCTDMTYKISSTSSHTSCMRKVVSGTIDGSYYLPNGATMAGSLPSGCGNAIYGVPNTDLGYEWNCDDSLAIHKNLSRNLKPSVGSTVSYSIDPNSPVGDNFVLKNAGGSTMYVDPLDSASTSSNGQWMVIEANGGFSRVDLQTFDLLTFAPWQSKYQNSIRTAISDDGRYALVHGSGNDPSTRLMLYDLSTCSPEPNVSCQSRSLYPIISSAIPGLTGINTLRFVTDDMITFKGYSTVNGVSQIKQYKMFAPGVGTSGLQYLGLGDSYSSGEGAGKYMRGTDESVNSCHTSLNSYPNRITKSLNYTSAEMRTEACSGAQTKHVTNVKQHPTLPANNLSGNWLPGYNAQLDAVKNFRPNAMTITMGGNDIGFGKTIIRCLEQDTCFSTYEERLSKVNEINSQFPAWVSMYKNLMQSGGSNAKLYVVGYPQVVSTTGSCAINVRLNSSERDFSQKLITYLNYAIKQAALKAGAVYVDDEDALDGHKLCETDSRDVAVNGLTVLRNGKIVSGESYHPNFLGQQKMSSAILSDTSNFTETPQAPDGSIAQPKSSDTDTALTNLLNAPHGTLPISNTQAIQNSTNDFIDNNFTKGQSFTYHVGGINYGLKPNTTYHVSLNSTPTSLGDYTTDSGGNLDISGTVPTTIDAGIHQLDITGQNLSGESIDLYDTAYVADSSADYNGDGVPNSSDPCEYFDSSGIDADQDGIDDACDGYVGIAPLYRARNGNAVNGEDPNLIYIDRNVAVASSLGITDYNPNAADWVTIAHTAAGDDASSSIANFTTRDIGFDATNSYDRYVPVLSTRTSDNGCVSLAPASLAAITQSSGPSAMQVDGTNTDTCRSQPSTADVDNNGTPDNQQALYRARNGIAVNGEDPSLLYIERNTYAAEAILGISDYDPNSTGWALIGVSSAPDTGTYNSIVLIDPTTNQVVSASGTVSADSLNTMSGQQLQTLVPEVLFSNTSVCSAVTPTDLSVVKSGQSRSTQAFTLLNGQTCN